jgi:hypothetical protein
MPNKNNKWQEVWPDEAGFWWFYGYKWNSDEKEGKPKQLSIVRAFKVMNGFSYIIDGHFMYTVESGNGVFKKIELPKLP